MSASGNRNGRGIKWPIEKQGARLWAGLNCSGNVLAGCWEHSNEHFKSIKGDQFPQLVILLEILYYMRATRLKYKMAVIPKIHNSKFSFHSKLHNLCRWDIQKNIHFSHVPQNCVFSFSGSSGETTSSISSTSSSGSAETGQLALFSFISPTHRSNEQHYLRAALAGNMHLKNGLLLSSKEKCGTQISVSHLSDGQSRCTDIASFVPSNLFYCMRILCLEIELLFI
jgi:hypothetical protein